MIDPLIITLPCIHCGWCSHAQGQDFMRNSRAGGIDYVSIHFWPDRWKRSDAAFARNWLGSHISDAAAIGKPLVLEEFGAVDGGRDNIYRCAR